MFHIQMTYIDVLYTLTCRFLKRPFLENCRICVTDFREGGLFPGVIREQPQKGPSWIGLNTYAHNLVLVNILFTIKDHSWLQRDNRKQINYYSKRIIRSSRSQMFFKIDVLKKFTICTEKSLSESLFNKLAALKACNFVIKSCFSVNIAKFFRTAFYRTPPVTDLNNYLQY